jgi:iron(III) transport system permease protein
MALIALERGARRGKRFHNMSRRYRPIRRARPPLLRRWIVFGLCFLPVLFGFFLPAGIIAWHAVSHLGQWSDPAFWRAALHTAGLATSAAVAACLIGLFMVYGARSSASRLPRIAAQATALGYAVPGAVLAVGVLMPLAAFDHWLADTVEAALGVDIGLLLTGSAAAIVFAHVVRFVAIAHGAIDGALGRVTPSMELAARTLGSSRRRVLARIHVPMIRGSLLTAALLIFVDSAKELPATLILRPFDFETLATSLYNAASLEKLAQSGPAALAIIAVGLAPVLLLARMLERSRPGETAPPGTRP